MSLSYNSWFFKIYCNFFRKKIGVDNYGNQYLKKKKPSQKNNFRQRRFVIYKGNVEASKIPQEWNAWLHHITDEIPDRKPTNRSGLKNTLQILLEHLLLMSIKIKRIRQKLKMYIQYGNRKKNKNKKFFLRNYSVYNSA